jgi:hypothetical protein
MNSRSGNGVWVNIAVVLALIAGAIYIFNHLSWRTVVVIAVLAVAIVAIVLLSRATRKRE